MLVMMHICSGCREIIASLTLQITNCRNQICIFFVCRLDYGKKLLLQDNLKSFCLCSAKPSKETKINV